MQGNSFKWLWSQKDESQGHHTMALTVVYVPYSLDGGMHRAKKFKAMVWPRLWCKSRPPLSWGSGEGGPQSAHAPCRNSHMCSYMCTHSYRERLDHSMKKRQKQKGGTSICACSSSHSRRPLSSLAAELYRVVQFSIQEHFLSRILERFRGGLVCKAHRMSYHSTLGSRVMKKRRLTWRMSVTPEA